MHLVIHTDEKERGLGLIIHHCIHLKSTVHLTSTIQGVWSPRKPLMICHVYICPRPLKLPHGKGMLVFTSRWNFSTFAVFFFPSLSHSSAFSSSGDVPTCRLFDSKLHKPGLSLLRAAEPKAQCIYSSMTKENRNGLLIRSFILQWRTRARNLYLQLIGSFQMPQAVVVLTRLPIILVSYPHGFMNWSSPPTLFQFWRTATFFSIQRIEFIFFI